MRVVVVGAGALGRLFGVRLAAGGADVEFVVRPGRASEKAPFAVEEARGLGRRDLLARPRRVTAVSGKAEVVLVAVRFDQLEPGGEVARLLASAPARAPVVSLTPLLPRAASELEAAIGRPVSATLIPLASYVDGRGVVRFWKSDAAPVLVEAPGEGSGAEAEGLGRLCRQLRASGLAARLSKGVLGSGAALTVSFFPLYAALDTGGGVGALARDSALAEVALAAGRETAALGRKLGPVPAPVRAALALARPRALAAAAFVGRALAPELVGFIETHFGAKLHAQHLAMGEAILSIGREHGAALPALERLLDLVRERGGSA